MLPAPRFTCAAMLLGLAFSPLVAMSSPTPSPVSLRVRSTGNVGENWSGPVQFLGSGTTDFQIPGLLDLGEFHLQRIPGRTKLGVEDLPFEIMVQVWMPHSAFSDLNAPTILIEGRIDGQMKGIAESSLVPQITSISSPLGSPPLPFDLSTFSVQLPEVIRPYAEGPTRVYGYVSIPEPSALATLLAGAGLLVLGRVRHRWRTGSMTSA